MPKVTVVSATLNHFTAAPIHSTRKRRVAAYARVSTNDEEQANSYEAQVSHYTCHIQENPEWEFVSVYQLISLFCVSALITIQRTLTQA